MKKMLVTLAFLNTLFFMSTACSQDDSNYIQPKFEDLGAYTPDDISNWPHAIFSFNDWACTDMQMADNRLGIFQEEPKIKYQSPQEQIARLRKLK